MAAEKHAEKIKKRKGKFTLMSDEKGYHLAYSFPEKKQYDVISPDGFSIRMGVEPFKTIKERDAYFKMWKSRFQTQGYYSSVNFGKINLADLSDYCEWIEL